MKIPLKTRSASFCHSRARAKFEGIEYRSQERGQQRSRRYGEPFRILSSAGGSFPGGTASTGIVQFTQMRSLYLRER